MVVDRSVGDGVGVDPGFTLVEILIAIVLVGILSAVVVVGLSNMGSKGSTGACQVSMDAARSGSAVYYNSTGGYPATISDMTTASPPSLTLSNGITINATSVGSQAAGTIATGNGWTLTMSSGTNGGPPTFTCS
jgi:prepilin-type N-terminal cleavage/methylation domain-containing protein